MQAILIASFMYNDLKNKNNNKREGIFDFWIVNEIFIKPKNYRTNFCVNFQSASECVSRKL